MKVSPALGFRIVSVTGAKFRGRANAKEEPTCSSQMLQAAGIEALHYPQEQLLRQAAECTVCEVVEARRDQGVHAIALGLGGFRFLASGTSTYHLLARRLIRWSYGRALTGRLGNSLKPLKSLKLGRRRIGITSINSYQITKRSSGYKRMTSPPSMVSIGSWREACWRIFFFLQELGVSLQWL
jgi:glycerate kinase